MVKTQRQHERLTSLTRCTLNARNTEVSSWGLTETHLVTTFYRQRPKNDEGK